MRKSKTLLFALSLAFLGAMLFSACSKDDKENPEPTPPEVSTGSVSATITFSDQQDPIQFNGRAIGGIVNDTVAVHFSDKNSTAAFFLMLAGVKKGTLEKGVNGFECAGWFTRDSTQSNIMDMYLIGYDNFEEGGNIKDAATFKITSLSNNRIKGTFTATMVQNTTVGNGNGGSTGEIKTIKVTKGKFDVPLFNGADID